LALVVVAMALYRRSISVKDEETLHLSDPSESAHQVVIAHKLEHVDKWGKVLTIVAVVYGVLLAVAYTYQTWVQATNLGI
jgi:hypothetical protein